MTAHFRLGGAIPLDAQNADHQLQAVLHPVIDFPKQYFMARKSRLQIALEALSLDLHAENICGSLEECQVIFRELTFRAAVNLQYAEGGAVALQDDVDRAMDAVFQKQFRCLEAIFVSQMVGDDRIAGVQRKPPGRFKIRADSRFANDAGLPPNTGTNHQAIGRWQIFQDLAELRLHPVGRENCGLVNQFVERRALQGQDAKLGQYLLLAHAQPERTLGHLVPFWWDGGLFDHWFLGHRLELSTQASFKIIQSTPPRGPSRSGPLAR